MAEKTEEECCDESSGQPVCCQVMSLISVDERGQTVLPKEVRDKMGIKAGDKLAVILSEGSGDACCLVLMKADELTDMVKIRLGPVMEEMAK